MKGPKATQLPSGNWNAGVMANGKRVSFTCATKEEAERQALIYKQANKVPRKTDTNKRYEKLILGILSEPECQDIPQKVLPDVATILAEIDSMSGIHFEEFCSHLLMYIGAFNGGNIHTTKKSGDFGADLIISCLDGKKIAVQCKRSDYNIGISAVQEVVASKTYYRADACMVLTNRKFTPSAKNLAISNGVVLCDRRYSIMCISTTICCSVTPTTCRKIRMRRR